MNIIFLFATVVCGLLAGVVLKYRAALSGGDPLSYKLVIASAFLITAAAVLYLIAMILSFFA